ncbi:hypothetical protein C4565_03640 [Candidatus Parcubacteria bacterium]|nr:MAG: hypothetical protein C4565_03640 [Candidatus Parcubacteria bacterium]
MKAIKDGAEFLRIKKAMLRDMLEGNLTEYQMTHVCCDCKKVEMFRLLVKKNGDFVGYAQADDAETERARSKKLLS